MDSCWKTRIPIGWRFWRQKMNESNHVNDAANNTFKKEHLPRFISDSPAKYASALTAIIVKINVHIDVS